MPRDSLPAAADVFAGLPPPLPDDGGIRESVRAIRAADGLLLGVLDDDPTGSQAVHGPVHHRLAELVQSEIG